MKIPDTLIIVSLILLLFVGLTWILPAGEFERQTVNGQEVIVPNTYKTIPPSPQGVGAFLMAPIKGFVGSAQIIAFILIIGGAFSLLNKTGAIEAGLESIIRLSLKKTFYKKAIIPVLMILFSLAGATFGMCEEVLVFILITIPFSLSLGYDSLVGVAIPFVGAGAGFAGAFTNPFTVGIAQSIAELPPFTGWEYRLFVWFVLTLTAIVFVVNYASRLERGKVKSSVHLIDLESRESLAKKESVPFTGRRAVVLGLFLTSIVLLIIGVNNWNWYIDEITGLFLALALIAAAVFGIGVSNSVAAFVEGAKDMMTAVLVIALAKGILVVASDGKIIDTILFYLAGAADGFPRVASVEMMFVIQNVLNFFVPSGSGLAALTMPIMTPLSDLLSITRQTSVLIFQLGDGVGNMIIPTSGVTMGVLAIARIPYQKWIRWIWPLMLLFFLLAMLLLIPPVLFFHYGPR